VQRYAALSDSRSTGFASTALSFFAFASTDGSFGGELIAGSVRGSMTDGLGVKPEDGCCSGRSSVCPRSCDGGAPGETAGDIDAGFASTNAPSNTVRGAAGVDCGAGAGVAAIGAGAAGLATSLSWRGADATEGVNAEFASCVAAGCGIDVTVGAGFGSTGDDVGTTRVS